eukprot:15330-Heterococcus_DN1.PRE.1
MLFQILSIVCFAALLPACAAVTLEDLLGRVPVQLFLEEFYTKQPIHVRRGGDVSGFAQMLHLDEIDTILQHGIHISNDTITASPMLHGDDYKLVRRVRASDGEWWSESMAVEDIPMHIIHGLFSTKGYTLVINHLKHRWTPIAETCLALQHTFGHLVNANAYLTPPDAQGFEAHFDWMDAFVLQLHGTKRWLLYPQLQEYPSPETKFKPTPAQLGQPIADIVLQPGDFLYIPRGFPHEATTILSARSTDHTASPGDHNSASSSAEASLHVTFGLESAVHTSYSLLLHHAIDVLNTLHNESSNNITDTCQCSDNVATVEAVHELVNASAVAVASLRRQVNMMINIKDFYRDFAQCVDDVMQHYSTTMAIAEPIVCNVNSAHIETAVIAAAVNGNEIAQHQQQQHQQQQQNHKCILCQLQQLRVVQPEVFTAALHAMQSEFNAKQATWLSNIQRNLQLCEQPRLLIDH